MSDLVTAALDVLAGALDGMSLDDAGGNRLQVHAGGPDAITPPAAIVEPTGVMWAKTGRTDGTANLEATITVIVPAPTYPVALSMLQVAMADVRHRIIARAGKTLDDTVQAWRMVDATLGTAQVGARNLPAVTFRLELWLPI